MIVSFSGIDSAGKTTQLALLCRDLDEQKIRYKQIWSKARGTPGVLFLKSLLRRDRKLDDAQKVQYREAVFQSTKKKKLLYIASMLDLLWYWGVHYRLMNLTHRYVLCDRYLWDTYVELCSDFMGIDIDRSKLFRLVRRIAAKPRVSFVFLIPAELSLERDRQKNAAGIEDLTAKKEKISRYMQLAEKGAWTNVMDGTKPIDELHSAVLRAIAL